jgi:hypothetical protein
VQMGTLQGLTALPGESPFHLQRDPEVGSRSFSHGGTENL